MRHGPRVSTRAGSASDQPARDEQHCPADHKVDTMMYSKQAIWPISQPLKQHNQDNITCQHAALRPERCSTVVLSLTAAALTSSTDAALSSAPGTSSQCQPSSSQIFAVTAVEAATDQCQYVLPISNVSVTSQKAAHQHYCFSTLLPLPSHGAKRSCTSHTSCCELPVYHRKNGSKPSGGAELLPADAAALPLPPAAFLLTSSCNTPS